jgi:hypothetical protein
MRQWIKILMMVLLLIVGTIPVAFARGGPGGFHGGFHGGGFGHGGFHGGFHDGFHGWHGGHWGHFHHPHFHGGIIVEVPPLWIAPEPSYVAPAPSIGLTPEPPAIWYYCTDPPGYYPTVPTCRVPWTLYPQD